jgi:hypothetical protein
MPGNAKFVFMRSGHAPAKGARTFSDKRFAAMLRPGDHAMTKFERAMQAAGQLPEDMREQLGDDLLHFIDKYLALRDDIDIGLRELDAGEIIEGEVFFAELKARLGV